MSLVSRVGTELIGHRPMCPRRSGPWTRGPAACLQSQVTPVLDALDELFVDTNIRPELTTKIGHALVACTSAVLYTIHILREGARNTRDLVLHTHSWKTVGHRFNMF